MPRDAQGVLVDCIPSTAMLETCLPAPRDKTVMSDAT